jgi:hypothetical protein
MFRMLRTAALTAACMAVLAAPAMAGSCRTASMETRDVVRMGASDCSLRKLEDRLRGLGEQAKQAAEDAIAAGRAAVDAGLAKLREREQARRHGKGQPRPDELGGDVANT